MIEKGLDPEITLNETPNYKMTGNKPLNSIDLKNKKVDINVLIARAQKLKDKQYKNSAIIFTFFLTILIVAGVYLTI